VSKPTVYKHLHINGIIWKQKLSQSPNQTKVLISYFPNMRNVFINFKFDGMTLDGGEKETKEE
jgi:hypothetical protein